MFSVSKPLVIQCLGVFIMSFVQKRRISIFSHWLIMGRSQNWPDLRSSISKFWDIHFVHAIALSNRWKFQSDRSLGVAMTDIETFYEVRSLQVTWWPDLEWPWSEIFTTCVELMYDKVYQKRRRSAPPFLRYSRKTTRGVFKHPPSRARVKKTHWIATILSACHLYVYKISMTWKLGIRCKIIQALVQEDFGARGLRMFIQSVQLME